MDCDYSPGDLADHEYPSPAMSRAEMMDWFANNTNGFGMNENQVRKTIHSSSNVNRLL